MSASEFPTVSDFVFKSLNRRFLGYYDCLMTLITTLEVFFFLLLLFFLLIFFFFLFLIISLFFLYI